MSTQQVAARVAPLFLVLATGCLRLDQALQINPDGSGSLRVAYSVSEQSITQFQAMRKLTEHMAVAAGKSGGGISRDDRAYLFLDPEKPKLEREIAKYERYGIAVDELEVDSRNARRNVRLQIRFESLARLAESDLFAQYGFLLYRGPRGNVVFDRPAALQEDVGAMDFNSPEMVRLLTPMLGGFNVVLRVTTPGAILRTNASSHTRHTATWIFDFDRDPNALWALQRQRLLILFEGKDVNLPTIRHDASD